MLRAQISSAVAPASNSAAISSAGSGKNDPSVDSWTFDFTLEEEAPWFEVTLEGPGDGETDLDLFVMFDANGDGEFEWEGEDVRIVGNGAILDLQGEHLCIAYCSNRLEIDNCVVLNGDIRYRGYTDSTHDVRPTGFVKQVTFYKPHDYAVRMFASGQGIQIERNIVQDAVDTGLDFLPLTGEFSPWLPTGASFAASLPSVL